MDVAQSGRLLPFSERCWSKPAECFCLRVTSALLRNCTCIYYEGVHGDWRLHALLSLFGLTFTTLNFYTVLMYFESMNYFRSVRDLRILKLRQRIFLVCISNLSLIHSFSRLKISKPYLAHLYSIYGSIYHSKILLHFTTILSTIITKVYFP